MTDRWIELDGIVNMRDLGGLPTRDGGHTASGRLIRSDNLQDLTEADVQHLVEELGVTDVVDLRTETELHLEGPGPLRRVLPRQAGAPAPGSGCTCTCRSVRCAAATATSTPTR